MARNYTFAEAVEIIAEGKDLAAIQDLGRRYPILVSKVSKVSALAGESFTELMGFMPEHLSANKVNTAIKNLIDGGSDEDDSEDTDAEEKKDVKPAKPAKTEEVKDSGYASKTGDALIAICKERGLAWKGLKKAQLIEVLEEADAAKPAKGVKADTKAKAKVEEETEDETETEETDVDYSEMSAMDLFKLCKTRGIKAEPKKPAKFYIGLLEKADEAATEEDEEWEEEEVPAKPAKGGKAKANAKPAKEDDEEWDI